MLGKVLLPASLAVGIATTDLTDVNWSFVLGNTLAKAAIMVAVALVCFLLMFGCLGSAVIILMTCSSPYNHYIRLNCNIVQYRFILFGLRCQK